ncbi:MAG: HAD family hydrolase [Planctomycetes bacterium]|nr:HAD family hydrolase [Planctomycetota bacterium]
MITTVIFDMDDTLYDEIDYCRSGFAAVSEFVGGLGNLPDSATKEAIFRTLWAEFTAGNHTSTFNTALEKLGIGYDDGMIGDLVGVYRRHEPDITLPADSKAVLDQLREKYALGLLSDGFLPAQQLKVKALGIEPYFEHIVYTEELGRKYWKPSEKGFKMLIKALNARGENCVYVADNSAKDFIAPNKLGFETIQLVRPHRIHTDSPFAPEAAPSHIIGSISQLPGILGQL